jgi:hypothetical protein
MNWYKQALYDNPVSPEEKLLEVIRGDKSRKKPLCEHCQDAGRNSLAQEIRQGLKARGLWAPELPSDLINAIFTAIDKKNENIQDSPSK